MSTKPTNWAKQRRQMTRLGFALDLSYKPREHLMPDDAMCWRHGSCGRAIILTRGERPYSDAKVVDCIVSAATRKAVGDVIDAFDSARAKVMGRIPDRTILRRRARQT